MPNIMPFFGEKLDLTFCLTLWHLGLPSLIRGSEAEGVVPGADGVPGDVGGVEAVIGRDVRIACTQCVRHSLALGTS